MKYDIALLNEYINNGLLEVQTHPTFPLKIYNYTRECSWEKKWDEITLACRGLILDDDGNVVARPFGKFFNWEEHTPSEIPNEPFEIYEKMDGSYIICFYYDNRWICASRGSFMSDQAIKANELIKNYPIEKLDIKNTYLFEIIY